MHVTLHPVEVFEGCLRILGQLLFVVLAADETAFEIVGAVDIFVCGKKVVHDDKVKFVAFGGLDTVQAIELAEQGVGVVLDMFVVLRKNFAEELCLVVVYSLDDVLVVAGEIKEAAGLARRAEFGEDIFVRQGHEIGGRINVEELPEVSKDPWSIVLEFEVVFGRRGQLGAEDVKGCLAAFAEVNSGEVAVDLSVAS